MISTTSEHCPSAQFTVPCGFACFLLFKLNKIFQKGKEKSIIV